ncbi:MAG: metal ABC transporter ATP-binding protein [Sedimentisphaerales bacterium]|nr:metal ABC transporter ATP-binding protein [Sedimentisphaerales bacterium]
MENAITLSNICIKRGQCKILQIEHLAIPAGQFVGLIGPNGAGKTTFLKLSCGLIRPNQGVVHLNNQRISRYDLLGLARYRRHIGYIPQQNEYNAHLPFTVREVVAMGRNGLKPFLHPLNQTDYERVDFWIERMGLYERRHQTFRSLSGGQQQKTLIARAMTAEPHFIFMDEPGANLDPKWKRQLREIIDCLFEENSITIILISHEVDLIPTSCQRLVLLDRGRIVADGLREQIINSTIARRIWFPSDLEEPV